jgi:hypothetical protein
MDPHTALNVIRSLGAAMVRSAGSREMGHQSPSTVMSCQGVRFRIHDDVLSVIRVFLP